MYCKHCGAQLPDGSAFCSACGGQLDAVQPEKAVPAPVGSVKPAAALSAVSITKLALILALLAFFLPFVTVSCSSSESLSESYSGMEMITTLGSGNDELIAKSGKNAKSNIFVIASFGCGAAAAVFLFRKDDRKKTAILSAAAAGFLVIFRITFRMYYGLIIKDYKDYIKVKTKFGLLFCILMFAVVVCINWKEIMPAAVNAPATGAGGQQPPA